MFDLSCEHPRAADTLLSEDRDLDPLLRENLRSAALGRDPHPSQARVAEEIHRTLTTAELKA